MSEVDDAIAEIQKNKNIVLEGVCSHFADADGEDTALPINRLGRGITS